MKERNQKYRQVSQQTEEIIQLRVQLAKNKSKIQKYEEFVAKSEQYDAQLRSLLEQFSRKTTIIDEIAHLLGQQLQRNTANSRFSQHHFKSEKTQYFSHLISQYEELTKEWQENETALKLIKKSVSTLIQQDKDSIKKIDQFENTKAKLKQVEKINKQQKQKLKQMQLIIEQKDEQIAQLQRRKDMEQEKLMGYKQSLEQSLKKEQQLMDRITEQNRRMQLMQQESKGIKSINASKQRVLDNCKNLINVLSVGEDDYLRSYFRESGLPFQIQKPQKNKYSIVFDQ